MSTEEIIEGNKLIAEFMGEEYSEFNHAIALSEKEQGVLFYDPVVYLDYHSDWSLLIPVCNKVLEVYAKSETVRLKLDNEKNFVIKFGIKNMLHPFENKYHSISTWQKIIDFIKWYHKNN